MFNNCLKKLKKVKFFVFETVLKMVSRRYFWASLTTTIHGVCHLNTSYTNEKITANTV